MATDAENYQTGVFIVAALAFLPAWGYAIAQFGWFLGIAFGWIPAALFAGVMGLLWPLLAMLLGLAAIALFFLWSSSA